jgi:alpha-ketoglutarate-dependent taurine dioxygenase
MEFATTLMDGLAVSLLWQANDFVLVDNRTCMHSRKPYDPAVKRRVLASLINDPDR